MCSSQGFQRVWELKGSVISSEASGILVSETKGDGLKKHSKVCIKCRLFFHLQDPLICTNPGNFVFTEQISLHFRSEASFHIHCRYPRSNSPGFPVSACAETPGCCSQVPVLCTGKQRCLTVSHNGDKTTIPGVKSLPTSDRLSRVSNPCFNSDGSFL